MAMNIGEIRTGTVNCTVAYPNYIPECKIEWIAERLTSTTTKISAMLFASWDNSFYNSAMVPGKNIKISGNLVINGTSTAFSYSDEDDDRMGYPYFGKSGSKLISQTITHSDSGLDSFTLAFTNGKIFIHESYDESHVYIPVVTLSLNTTTINVNESSISFIRESAFTPTIGIRDYRTRMILSTVENEEDNYSDVVARIYFYQDAWGYGDIITNISINGVKKEIKYTEETFTRGSFTLSPYEGYFFLGELSTRIYHENDGSKSIPISIITKLDYGNHGTISTSTISESALELPSITRGATLLTAPNFTSVETATITYSNPLGNDVDALRACISLTGSIDDVPYRNISKTGTSYTFELTEEEIATLKRAVVTGNSKTVYFVIKTTLYGNDITSVLARTFTIADGNPKLSPEVYDTNPDTLVLTGDRDIMVAGFSNAFFNANAEADVGATITYQKCVNGAQLIESGTGTFFGVQSSNFVFTITDSRGNSTVQTIPKTWVYYVKPTCSIDCKLNGEGILTYEVRGNCYNGTFGAQNNNVVITLTYVAEGEELQSATLTPNFNDNSYTCSGSLEGLDYRKTYTVTGIAADMLMAISSNSEQVTGKPIFDWGAEDFNFNVPEVKIQETTVLQKKEDSKNVVLAAEDGGAIYIRPNGNDNTSGEVQIRTTGNVVLVDGANITTPNKELYINGELYGSGGAAVDYVVEEGKEGIFYYRKWNSGKAECWGKKNHGSVAITIAWGSIYRSNSVERMVFPTGLFVEAPDSWNVSVYNASMSVFLMNNSSTPPTTTQTGEIRFLRATSATVDDVTVAYNVSGRWK